MKRSFAASNRGFTQWTALPSEGTLKVCSEPSIPRPWARGQVLFLTKEIVSFMSVRCQVGIPACCTYPKNDTSLDILLYELLDFQCFSLMRGKIGLVLSVVLYRMTRPNTILGWKRGCLLYTSPSPRD